jgi:CheY-like chemotaxis protein
MIIKILLVEDSPTQAVMSRTDLQTISPAIQTIWVSTAKEALQTAVREPLPNLIVLDMNLPDGSGLDICRKLKTMEVTRPIPTVIFSTEPLSTYRKAAYEAGADQYITKGGTGDTTLKLLVSTLLRSQLRALPRIGEALVEKGYIKVEALQHALQVQQHPSNRNKLLGQILIELGYVTEQQVSDVLKSKQ